MTDNSFNMEESQKQLMQILVASTLRKYNVKKDNIRITDEEKAMLRQTVEHLQEQYKKLAASQQTITEADVDPTTNIYKNK